MMTLELLNRSAEEIQEFEDQCLHRLREASEQKPDVIPSLLIKIFSSSSCKDRKEFLLSLDKEFLAMMAYLSVPMIAKWFHGQVSKEISESN